MSEKDKASPRQRQIMEQRWANARKACGEGSCHANYRFHVAGCERRAQKVKVTNLNTGVTSEATIVHSDVRAVKGVLADHDKQAVRLEPLAEALDVPQEVLDAAEPGSGHYAWSLPGVVVVKDVNDLTQDELDQVAKVKTEGGVVLIPQELDFDRTYWDEFEKGQRAELFESRIIPVPKPEDVRALTPDEEAKREQLVRKIESDLVVYPGLEQYPQAPARPWWKFWGHRAR